MKLTENRLRQIIKEELLELTNVDKDLVGFDSFVPGPHDHEQSVSYNPNEKLNRIYRSLDLNSSQKNRLKNAITFQIKTNLGDNNSEIHSNSQYAYRVKNNIIDNWGDLVRRRILDRLIVLHIASFDGIDKQNHYYASKQLGRGHYDNRKRSKTFDR